MSTATANQPFVFVAGSTSASATADSVVHETRQEISQIVREVAKAVRREQTTNEFLSLLADRTLRAMAAEGVVVWRRCDGEKSTSYQPACRLGRVTDLTIPESSIGTHQRMLLEIGSEGDPVVVPATPGADDSGMPANPTAVPAAVAPIECEPSMAGADYLLEVFLEPEGGVATTRGYLRFVAQMADLAGEFLRADQLRTLRRQHALAKRIDDAIARMHRLENPKMLEAWIVDNAADLFMLDRVGLCRTDHKTNLLAISHVHTIDQRSPAADQIRQAALSDLGADGCAWIDNARTASDAAAIASTQEMVTRVVVGSDSSDSNDTGFRWVCLQSVDSEPIDSQCRDEMLRYFRHAKIALRALEKQSLLSRIPIPFRRRSLRQLSAVAAVFVIAAIGLFMPVPLVVHATATIHPSAVQNLSAHRDAVVDEIHVSHGQQVARNDKLLTLVDPSLDEQITTLVGRRSVLLEQQARLTEALVGTAANQMEHMDKVQSQRSLVAEEIQGVDEQIGVLRRIEQSLVVRADRDGIVDAWQIESRLQSRPVNRGQELLRVVSQDSSWTIEAHVPQNRIAHLQRQDREGAAEATVSIDAEPDRIFAATVVQIGPSVIVGSERQSVTAVSLQITDSEAENLNLATTKGRLSGAPARVMFACGDRAAGYVLFQDLIRSVRSTANLYLASVFSSRGD